MAKTATQSGVYAFIRNADIEQLNTLVQHINRIMKDREREFVESVKVGDYVYDTELGAGKVERKHNIRLLVKFDYNGMSFMRSPRSLKHYDKKKRGK